MRPGLVRQADEWLRDGFITLHATATPETRILVVDIDESSLADHPWPWSRDRLAQLIETVLDGGARGVALDILLEKPADAEGDARLAMLAQHGPVVLAQLFDYEARPHPLRFGQLIGGTAAAATTTGGVAAHGFIANHAGLARAAQVGNIGVQPDADGVLRHIPLYTNFEAKQYPTLALALLACCTAQGNRPATLPQAASERLAYSRTWDAYTVAKAADILGGRVPASLIEGRLVFIGSSSLSIGDRLATPLGRTSAGLLVHASLLSTLLDRQEGKAPATWPGAWIAVLFCAAVAGVASHTFSRRSAIANGLMLAASALLWLPLGYLVCIHDASFAVSGPLFSILFLMTVGVPLHWQLAQTGSRRLLDTMRRYVAGAVVDELLRSGLKDPLAPRRLHVTTLIADMEGYTGHVESLPVEDAARLTTDFLDCLTRPVLEKHGTLDKYTGDGLVAFWGAPLPNGDHADLALDAARHIVSEVRRLSERHQAAGHAPIRVRIGIESGPAMVGNFGSSFRSIYTAVGDSVNTASRLEQAARDLPHDVIIGEGTVSYAKRHNFTILGQRQLRGKEKLTSLYILEASA